MLIVSGAQLPTAIRADGLPLSGSWAQDVIRQTEDITCGPASLANLLQFQFGLEISQEQITGSMLGGRSLDAIRVRGGFSLLDIMAFVEARGLSGQGARDVPLHELAARLPAILQVYNPTGAPHFVVVLRHDGNRLAIADPAVGGYWITESRLASRWTGVAFTVAQP